MTKCECEDCYRPREHTIVNRFVMEDLNELLFKCPQPDCQNKSKYLDALDHLYSCEQYFKECR